MGWFREGWMRYVPSLTWQARPQIPRLLAEQPANSRGLDLGAGGRTLDRRLICLDFVPFANTDVLADVHALPFLDGSIDFVLGTGLLEHVTDDRLVLAEIARVLKPGGVAHLEVPFLQQYHDDPIDCRRFTVSGLERELSRVGLGTYRSGVHIGPTVCLITLFTYWISLWFEGPSLPAKLISNGLFFGASILLWPAKFLDRFLVSRKSAHRLAFGVYCTARKPSVGVG